MGPRPLVLHLSALSDAEYKLFTESLADITDDDAGRRHSRSDADYEQVSVGVREVRAWLRGRYPNVSSAIIEEILRLFCPTLSATDTLLGGQFFAALRLVVHAEEGKDVDRSLAFIQSHPKTLPTRPSSPKKPPAPKPMRRFTDMTLQSAPGRIMNPFSSNSASASQSEDGQPSLHRVPSIVDSSARSNNPFVLRNKASVPLVKEGKLPPLPPRKPPPPIPTASHPPPPRHASLASSIAPTTQSSPPKTVSHITSTLMKQSLNASRTGQTMKEAERNLSKERVLQVLKSSSAPVPPPRNRSTSPNKTSTSSVSTYDNAPPLPARRRKYGTPPTSSSSFEQIAYARNNNPFGPSSGSTSSSSSAPSTKHTPNDVQTSPPPRHPDQKAASFANLSRSNSQPGHQRSPSYAPPHGFTNPFPETAQSASPFQSTFDREPGSVRVGRSKSLHHSNPTDNTISARRKRPESVQVGASPFVLAEGESPMSLARLGLRDPAQPVSNIQRTIASLQPKLDALQPRLEKARYKAEAGISKRGFVRDSSAQRIGISGEEEEGLMGGGEGPWKYRRANTQGDPFDLDSDPDRTPFRENDDFWASGNFDRDNLKMPAGDGWSQL